MPDKEAKSLNEGVQEYTRWTDAELDAETEVDEEVVKATLASRGAGMRNILGAKQE